MTCIKGQRGFTTFELALVIIVFGLVFTTVMQGYKLYVLQQNKEKTTEAFDVSEAAILTFKANFGRYPCPAGPSIARNAANYGREQRAGLNCTATNGVKVATAVGVDMNNDGVDDKIFIGSVPFDSMLDPDNNPATNDGIQDIPLYDGLTYDGYGRRLVYAVTDNLTRITDYNDFYGAIEVVDENNNPITTRKEDANGNGVLDAGEDSNGNGVLDAASYAHMILVSAGENGRGAYTPDGAQTEACPAALPIAVAPEIATPENETENCDNDTIFLSGLRSDKNHSFNDDTARFMMNETSGLWTYTAGSNDKVRNTNAGRVGFGTNNPTERLEVAGDLRAVGSQSTQYCDPADPTRCMDPQAIGGNLASMQCPTGQLVVSVELNKVNCANGLTSPTPRTCPAGCYATGFQKTGATTTVICRSSTAPFAICP
jgi:type II secretory pathway pseudopilin PulG